MAESLNPVWLGFVASLIAGLGTGIGALWVLVLPRPSDRTHDALLSVAAGIMLGATFVSLLLPAIEHARAHDTRVALELATVFAGLFAGGGALFAAHRYLPHEHFILGREGPFTALLRRVSLFIIAIALHNFPEGMAVGVGFGATS